MAFDYKKEYKEFYLPPKTPQIVEIPAMNFLAVRGQGLSLIHIWTGHSCRGRPADCVIGACGL